jgi:hypothetical protein
MLFAEDATGARRSLDAMTAILFVILLAVLMRSLGASGILRWAGLGGAALGLGVVLGVDAGQGLPLLAGGCLVWLIGRAVTPTGLQHGS